MSRNSGVLSQGYVNGSSAVDYGNTVPRREYSPKTRPAAKPRSHFPEQILAISLILAIFLLAMAYISTQSIVISKGAEINTIKKEITTIQKQNDNLAVSISSLKSPSRIEKVALFGLGMVKADNTNMVYYVPQENKGNVSGGAEDDSADLKAKTNVGHGQTGIVGKVKGFFASNK